MVLIKIVLIGLNSSGKILELKKIITEKIKREDAIIWEIKYLIALSDGYLFLVFLSKGIKDKRLISRPIQADNQE